MSCRLHPTKNKKLPPGEPRWYQIEYYYPDPENPRDKLRNTIVRQFESERQAQLYDNKLKRAWQPQDTSISTKPLGKMVPDFLNYYEHELERRPRSIEAWLQGWNNLEAWFGRLLPNHISPELIEEYKRHRLAQKAGIRNNTVSKRTIQKELHNLSALLAYAVEKNYCDPLPFKIRGYKKKNTQAAPVIPPTPEQVREMFKLVKRTEVLPLYQSIYYTGCRSQEIRQLQRKHVYLEWDLITVHGKGGKWRIIPIVAPFKPIIEKLCKDKKPDDHVLISKRSGKPYSANVGRLDASAKAAGIQTHITPHVLRKCFSTHCLHWGVDMRAVQLLLGHEDIKTTETYTFLPPSLLAEKLKPFGIFPTIDGDKT